MGGSVIDWVSCLLLLVSDRDHPNRKWVLNENPNKDDNNDKTEKVDAHDHLCSGAQ